MDSSRDWCLRRRMTWDSWGMATAVATASRSDLPRLSAPMRSVPETAAVALSRPLAEGDQAPKWTPWLRIGWARCLHEIRPEVEAQRLAAYPESDNPRLSAPMRSVPATVAVALSRPLGRGTIASEHGPPLEGAAGATRWPLWKPGGVGRSGSRGRSPLHHLHRPARSEASLAGRLAFSVRLGRGPSPDYVGIGMTVRLAFLISRLAFSGRLRIIHFSTNGPSLR